MSTATAESTGLIQSSNGNGKANGQLSQDGAAVFYDRIADPLQFINEIGRVYWQSGAGGAKTEADGKLLAMVCACKRINVFEFSEKFHLVNGKPTLHADEILSRIRKAGYDVEWTTDLDDTKKAESVWTVNGRKTTVRYTIEDAVRSEVSFKDGSSWKKTPAAMLRAAVIRKGSKALCPEVLSGEVNADEFSEPPRVTIEPNGATPRAVDVDSRRKELQALQQESTRSDPVIEAQVESAGPVATTAAAAGTTQDQSPPFEVPDRPAPEAAVISPDNAKLTILLLEIETVAGKVGLSRAGLEEKLKAANPGFVGLENLEIPAAEQLLANLAAKVAQSVPTGK